MAEGTEREASKYPGFLAAEINPPTAVQPDWVDRLPLRLHRPRPGMAQQRHASGAAGGREKYFDGPGTQQVSAAVHEPSDPLVTVRSATT